MPRTLATTRQLVRDFGTCLSFNGVSSVVTVPSATSLNTPIGLTVASWVKRSRTGSRDAIISRFDGSISDGFIFELNADLLNLALFNANQTGGDNVGASKIIDYNWHHLAATTNGSTYQTYIDGVLDYSGTVNGGSWDFTTGTTSPLYLGAWRLNNRNLGGLLDETVIYNRVLSISEISTMYSQGSIPTNSLNAHYKLDEGSGTTATDSSGNGNTGTIANATYSTNVVMKPRSIVS